MKKIIALLLLLLVVNFTFAQKINYSVLSSDANGVTIKVDMPAYTTSNVDINGQTYQKLCFVFWFCHHVAKIQPQTQNV